MIRQTINITECQWKVLAYYAVDAYYTNEIATQLQNIGCNREYLERATYNMNSGQLNHGLCYSNMQTRQSILVIGLTSSAEQFLNSLTHELHHLTCHICEAMKIDINSEQAAYICGDIAMQTYKHTAKLLCKHCRNH